MAEGKTYGISFPFVDSFDGKYLDLTDYAAEEIRTDLIHLILIRENCGKRNAKTGRRFYQRPYFVSPAADLSFSNWVLVSSQYTATQFKAVALRYGLGLVAQVHGFNTWKLVAKEPCPHICPPIQLTLNAGEISKQLFF